MNFPRFDLVIWLTPQRFACTPPSRRILHLPCLGPEGICAACPWSALQLQVWALVDKRVRLTDVYRPEMPISALACREGFLGFTQRRTPSCWLLRTSMFGFLVQPNFFFWELCVTCPPCLSCKSSVAGRDIELRSED